VVEVSGANQYKTKPLALVRTWVPLTAAVPRAVPPAATAEPLLEAALLTGEAGAAGVAAEVAGELVEVAELPQAVRARAAAASPAAAHIFSM
jgi:hypothetical protein